MGFPGVGRRRKEERHSNKLLSRVKVHKIKFCTQFCTAVFDGMKESHESGCNWRIAVRSST